MTAQHTPITILVGPADCFERDCEEYATDEGDNNPDVQNCSHIREQVICEQCSTEGPEGDYEPAVPWTGPHATPPRSDHPRHPEEHLMTTYRIEFGHVGTTRPVPDLVITEDDPNAFHRAVAAHAIPHLTPVLTEMGHPEYADCLFRVDPADPSYGDFMWISLATGKGARFCPARITPIPAAFPAV
jgi:hypothetical protein